MVWERDVERERVCSCGPSHLSRWWMRLSVAPERIRPGYSEGMSVH